MILHGLLATVQAIDWLETARVALILTAITLAIGAACLWVGVSWWARGRRSRRRRRLEAKRKGER